MSEITGEVIRTVNLNRIYHPGGGDVHAVNNVSLSAPRGKMTAVVGPSGSGKTTFLNLIAGLDTPDSGEIWLENQRIDPLSDAGRREVRLQKIGFVFQSFGLLPLLSAVENVGLPLRMRYMDSAERERRASEALSWVGLSDRVHHRPHELSGGEQQRVAIARALAAQPQIILADEPTGQLDTQTGQRIIDLLRQLVAERGITALVVTHDPKMMRAADVVHELRDGHLVHTVHSTGAE